MEIRKREADLRQLDLVLQHHQRERPSVADVLPDNPIVTAWKDRQNLLISRKREVLAYLDSHRSQRAIAQAAERKARNELNEARLHATRREIKEVRSLFEPLRVAIENFDLRCAEIDRTLQQVNEEVSRLESLKGFFPDPANEDVQRLNREVERLLKRRGDLIRQKNSAPDRMEAIKLHARLDGLLQQERTLVDELRAVQAETKAARLSVGLPMYAGLSAVR